MGYFSDEDLMKKSIDREEYIEDIGKKKEERIQFIMSIFPNKTKKELARLDEASLNGLYGSALRLKQNAANAYKNMMDNVRELEEAKRHGL